MIIDARVLKEWPGPLTELRVLRDRRKAHSELPEGAQCRESLERTRVHDEEDEEDLLGEEAIWEDLSWAG